jgi:peroxiredoxin
LSDHELAVTKSFGIVNEENSKLPHPAAVVVDTHGAVRWVRIDVNYRERPSAEELLAALTEMETTTD